jgi:hypothetical protein
MRRVKAPLADVVAVVGAPIVGAALRSDDHVVKNRPPLLPIDPQQPLRFRQAFVDIPMGAVEGDTAMAVRRPGQEGVGKRPAEFCGTIDAPGGLASDRQR